jgi:hypothetical protein
VEIQNESSQLFWTFNPEEFVPELRELIERRFGEWAAAKYGSIETALQTWGSERSPGDLAETSRDLPDEGRLGLYPAGHLTNNDWAVNQRNAKRAGDQLRFMVEVQRGFYEEMVKAWREELGVENLVTCSNWTTADPRTLGVLEHYTYMPGDAVCRNVYYSVDYDPPQERFYAVDVGDTFEGHSALRPPGMPEPLTVAHMEDRPYMITENNWVRPNRFRVEWPFLVATYAQMMGVDGWTFFALDGALWTSQMSVWEVNCPSVLGQFPAAALVFRSGCVEEAPAAVTDRLALEDLYAFTEAALYELTGEDVLWTARIGDRAAGTRAATRVDPLAFFVGKVMRTFAGPPGTETAALEAQIHREAKVVRSLTGELAWDYGRGVVVLDTPRAQGACGFLAAAGRIELGDVVIESGNEYGAVLVVSLDGEPVAGSKRVLIQAGTEDKPYGFATQPVGSKERITDLGGYPMNVRRVKATVTLKGAGAVTAQVLDENGYRTGRRATVAEMDAGPAVTLPEDALYTLVE